MGMLQSSFPIAYSNLIIKTWWDSEYGEEQLYQYKRLFKIETSERAFEQATGYTGFDQAPVKGEADAFSIDNSTQTYSTIFKMLTYASGFEVSQEAKEDSRGFDVVKALIPQLKRSLLNTVNTICSNVFNQGFNINPVNPTGDKVPLFSDVHPTRAGLQSNILATPADLSYTVLLGMITQMMQTRSDRGNPTPLMPKTLVLPPPLWNTGTVLLKTMGAPGNANNDVNAIQAYGSKLFNDGIAINNFLTDPNAYFAITDARDGLTYYERIAPDIQVVPSIISPSGGTQVRARMRAAANVIDWRSVIGSQGAS